MSPESQNRLWLWEFLFGKNPQPLSARTSTRLGIAIGLSFAILLITLLIVVVIAAVFS